MGKAQRRKPERLAAPRPAVPASPRPVTRDATAGGLIGTWLAALLIAVAVLVFYANSFSIPFLFDDFFEITNNPAVKALEPVLHYARRSRGIPALTLALNYRWGGLDVWGFHLFNVLIHLANGLLVYALVLRTLRLPGLRERYRSHAEVLATLVALVFVAHPLQTMAASYIVQRAESLAAFFYLLTLLLFSLAATSPGRGRRIALYAAAALSALLGVLSKEVVATVPVAALLYRVCFLRRSGQTSRLARLGLAALLLLPFAYGLVLARPYLLPARETVGPNVPRAWLYIPSAGFQIEGINSWQYLLTQFGVIVWYLRLYVLPTRLCFDYGWPFADSPWRADVLLPLIVLLGLVGAAIVSYRRYALATFCLLWVFITLAPSSSIVPLRDAAFEHRMYLPIVGLSWLVVVGGFDLLDRLAGPTGIPLATLRRGAAGAVAAWIALLGIATMARNGVMRDPIALAADSAAKAPGNWRAHSAYAEALLDAHRDADAMPELEQAIQLNPQPGSPRVELGQIYLRARRFDDAERVLLPATTVIEESVAAAASQQLAIIYEQRGDRMRSQEMLRTAVALKPGWSSVHQQLAAFYARSGFWYGAAGHYNEALRLNSRLLPALGAAASAANIRAAGEQLENGALDEALRFLQQALRYQPDSAVAHEFLVVVQARAGDWEAAQSGLDALARSRPDDPWVRDNMRRAHERQPLEAPVLGPAAAN
jgi:protein O-mannosyl-transferase